MSFTHQGWLSSDQKYLVFGDEFDEQYGRGGALGTTEDPLIRASERRSRVLALPDAVRALDEASGCKVLASTPHY